MKKIAILMCSILFALVGCGSEAGNDNHGLGFNYDQIGETGLHVRYAAGQTTPSLSRIETVFREVETCASITATGPLIIFLDFSDAGITTTEPGTLLGLTHLDTGTVLINTHAVHTVPEERYTIWTLRHEFIHYLLHQSGFDYAANYAHQSDLFVNCVEL